MSNSRIVQDERGTWLAHWCGDPTENPPIEEREWLCMECFDKFHEILSHRIDWDKVEQQVGKEESDRVKNLLFITGRLPKLRERIQQIEELGMKSEIFCRLCNIDLSHAAEALVEIY